MFLTKQQRPDRFIQMPLHVVSQHANEQMRAHPLVRHSGERLEVVGDRGTVTQVNIEALRKLDGVDWIGALKSPGIAQLIRDRSVVVERFDEVNLFEVLHPDYPGERLVACRNRARAQKRAAVREELLSDTESKLDRIRQQVLSGRLSGRAEIGVKVGEVINSRKVKKHFIVEITDDGLDYRRNTESIAVQRALDGG